MQISLAKFLKTHKQDVGAAVAITVVYLVLFSFDITCPIKFLTGISCPGCGMTRACLHAIRLDFASAFAYHPLWPLLPISVVLFAFFTVKGMKKASQAVIYVFTATMLFVYFIRIFQCDGNVVVFDPENGFIYKVVKKALSLIF